MTTGAKVSRPLRAAFLGFWFFLVPLGLAALTVWVVQPTGHVVGASPLDQLRYWVDDQPVPSLIVLFTLFEMALYRVRHSLPLAAELGVGGRADVPRAQRKDFELAGQLLEEAERILTRRRAAVARVVPSSVREDLSAALADLKDAMEAEPFRGAEFGEAHADARELVDRHLAPWRKSELREYAESIGIAVGVALLLRAFVVEAFKIPSGSMLPTLQIQDHIFVNKFRYGPTIPYTRSRLLQDLPPDRGDVIVFETPDPSPHNEGQDFIKRVIALPGDTLAVEGGHPIINGWRVPSCSVGEYEFQESAGPSGARSGELVVEYLGEATYLTLYEDSRSDGRQGPYVVKPGEVWVLGDNRNNSSDSRAWFGYKGGGVPFANVKGRAMFVWLSFGLDGRVTWDRLLTNVMGKPRLPKGAPQEIVANIERCVLDRAKLATTIPPPPR